MHGPGTTSELGYERPAAGRLERLELPGAEMNPDPEETPIRRWHRNGAFDLDSEWWGQPQARTPPPSKVLRRRPGETRVVRIR